MRIRLAFALIFFSGFVFGQIEIQDLSGNKIDTIHQCGTNPFDLKSSVNGTTASPLTWTTSLVNGAGTLAISNNTSVQPSFTPSTTSFAFYQINLSQGTGSATAYVAVAAPPTLPGSLPMQICENNGPSLIGSIGSNQTYSSNISGSVYSLGSFAYLNPQGLSNGTNIVVTLTETFSVPGSNPSYSFDCSSSATVQVTKPTNPTISLGSSFIIKCQTSTSLTVSPSGGSFIIKPSGATSFSPISSSILNNGNLNTQLLNSGAGQSLGYFYTDANGCKSDTAYVTFGVVEPNVSVQAFNAGSYTTITPTGGVYSWCGNYTSQLFRLNLPNASNFPTYDVDWGDGTSTTGNSNTSSGATHTYSIAGLYNVTLTLYNSSGCSVTKNLSIFYGTTPPVDLGNPGSLTGCYDGTNGISLFFPINNPLDLPIGLQMTFSSNDGSTPITVTTPLIDTSVTPSVTAHPNIIDSSNGKLYYKHTFFEGSCGYTSTLGTTYPNSFYVSATCVSPCGTGADPVGPIYISESPTAAITGPTEICTQTTATFSDASASGNAISLNGNTCSTITKGVWKIFPSTYTVTSGSLGSVPGQTYISDFSFWSVGSNSIGVQFNKSGTYTVRRLIGLTSSNDPLCTIDSVDHIICVDTVPLASLLLSLPDTSCIGNTLNTSMNLDSVNCSEASKYQFSVYDSTYTSLIYQSSNSTNTTFSWTPSSRGTYVVEYKASNSCGVNSLLDTIVIFDASFNINLDSCAPWTPNISHVINGDNLAYNWTITPVGSFTSLATLTNANTNSPSLSFADLQYPDANQNYTLTLTVTSSDGCTHSYSQTLTLYARPNADFDLPANACGPITVSPTTTGTDYGSNGTITSWNWTVTDGASFSQTATTANPSFNLPVSTAGAVTYTFSQTITDDNGCSDVVSKDFTVFPTPTANFSLASSTCTGTNINTLLTNNSSANDNSNNQLSYTWTIDSAGTTTTFYDSIPNQILLNNDTTTITYTVTLSVTNQYGCDSSIIDSILVFPNAIADIDTNGSLSACAPFTITNTIVPTINYSNNGAYSWTIKDLSGTIIKSFNSRGNLNHTILNSSDTVWIILNVSSAQGCLSDTDSILAYTLPNPDPAFTLASDTGCTAFNPALDTLALSTGLHVWEIFDASSNLVGPVLTGTSPNFPTLLNSNSSGLTTYTIHHTVFATDSSSCDSLFIRTVYVQPLAVPSINSIATYCALDTINLSGTSTNNSNVSDWTWTIGTDTLNGQNVSYFNSTPGQYTVSLTTITYDNCDTTVYDTLIIHSYPKAQIWIDECGLDTVCLNQSFTFNDSSVTYPFGGNITQYAWDFDNDGSVEYTSSSASHSFSSTGIRQLKLSVTTQFGCIDDTIIDVYVNAPPFNNFEIVDSSICGPSTFAISVTDTGIIDSSYYELYVINSGTKTVIQTWNSTPISLPILQPNYMSDTTYFMSRSLHNCCGVTTEIDSIKVQTPPVADFIILPDSGCTPLNTVLQLDGFIKGQADSAYVDFGDGSTQSLTPTKISQGSGFVYQWGQVPHAFVYGGLQDTTYYVTLTVYNNCGDSSLTLPVYVQPNTAQAAFGMNKSSGCAPLTVNFTNYSYNATTAAWCFDWNQTTANCNGGGSVALNPTWTFTQSGTYTVALFVDNGCGYDTAFQTVTVFPSPTAIISSNNDVCANDTVNFISNSTTPTGWIAGHLWEFGNGDTSILQNVDYLYDTSGTYTVTLTVTSSTGCSDSTTASIFIRPTPNVSFTTTNVCLNDTTFFDNLTTIPSGSIIGNAWNFGDGNSSNAFEPSHVYTAPGTYQVTLTHTSDYGCIDSSQQIAIVHDLPQLSFTPSLINGDSCSVPQTYLFTNNSTNSIQYNWDFDYSNNPGVNTSALTSPSFTFTAPGVYRIALFGETAFGCIDSLFTNILVRDGVNARHVINPTEGCEPLDVTFADTSIYTSSLDTIVSVEWFFGNGNSFIQTTAPFVYNYRYDNYGTYVVYNVVTMASGCLDTSAQTTINVYPTPDADFTISQVNIDTRTFVNLTSFVDSSITYYWTFSDGQTSTDISPTIRFEPSTSGLDSIKACLYVVNSFGCADSICKSFWVWPTNLIVPNAFAPDLNYIGEDALFLPKGHSLKEYEIWIYDQWGSLVWYSNEIDPDIKSPAEGWDGKHMDSGEPLPMGVYAWRIRALFDNNEFWTGQDNTHGFQKAYGTLTLIR